MNKNTDYKSKNSKNNKFDSKELMNFSRSENSPRLNLCDINVGQKGDSVTVFGAVERVIQTGGPTIFYISDGTGTLALKAFEGAGIRSHPDIDIGDTIKAVVKIEEYNDEIEGEVVRIWKLGEEDKKEFLEKLEKIERERARVEPIDFLVKSPILEKLKDRFIVAATAIRLAIIQSRPIIVRHHNDTDGYSSGYALEKAILPLIEKQHSSVKAAWEFYTRSPISAPMYEIDDSIRDTSHSLSNAAKFSNKMPLVIIADTGSGEEDLLGIKQGKVHGLDFIVVDHHEFEKDVVSEEVLANINPHLVGESGSKFSAGMLCTELARFINPDKNLNIMQIPAMAGLADRTDNPEAINKYLEYAKEKGYTKELLNEIASVIDFVSAKLRFMEAREYIEVLFGEPMKKQKALVALLAPYIQNLSNKGLAIARNAAESKIVGNTTLQIMNIETSYPKFFYPKTGKVVGLLHDYKQEVEKIDNLVTIGIMNEAITIRATDKANFSVPELIRFLNKKLPLAFVEGGGHKNAGSISFLPNKQKEVLDSFIEYMKED